jgi:hypothetical protein
VRRQEQQPVDVRGLDVRGLDFRGRLGERPCSAVSTWSTSVQTTTTSLKGNVTEDSLKSASADVTKATDEFVNDLKGLGTPDTESGKKAKETLDTLAGQLKTNVQTIDKAVNEASGTSGALRRSRLSAQRW